jgi:cell wall-associated NlpC family hydrolase
MIEPQPGDFEVVPMGGQGGKLIQVAQILSSTGRLNYEHARLYLGKGKIVEAQPGGAVIRNYDVHQNDGGLWSTGLIDINVAERHRIVLAGISYGEAHVGYSEADYFAIAAYRFKVGILVPGLKSYVGSSKHMICSQLVDQCYADAGVQLFDDKRWPGYVTPGDLADLLTQLAASHA